MDTRHQHRAFRPASALLGLLLLLLGIAPARAWEWDQSTVDPSSRDRGQHCSLVFDSSGRAHVSYYQYDSFSAGSRNLIYATNPDPMGGGSWQIETVDGGTSVGTYSSVGIDSSGTVHIAYYDSEFANLLYAYKAPGGSWQRENVDGSGTVGQFCSIAVSSTGKAYIAYFDATTPALKLAEKVPGGSWVRTLVDTNDAPGLFTSITLRGGLQIAYYELDKRDLRYAKRLGPDTWLIETVDAPGDVGRFTSIAATETGVPLISYYDAGNGDLKMAEKENGSWGTETVASAGDVGAGTSLALDSRRRVHIAYHDQTNGGLWIASRYENEWVFDAIAPSGNVGEFLSLGFDSFHDGRLPQVVYYDDGANRLRHAWGSGEATAVGEEAAPPVPLSVRTLANPTRAPARLVVVSPVPAEARLEIFDVRGRLVRSLFRGRVEAGERSFHWDGRDGAGRRVAAGRYVVVATQPTDRAATSLVFLP